MKSFKAYLTESTRTYDFKVRIAGDLTTEDVDKIKVALEQYKVVSVSKPKTAPIHETELFPNMGPVAVNVMEVSVAYPARDEREATYRNFSHRSADTEPKAAVGRQHQ